MDHVEDTDVVLDSVIDRVLKLQLEHKLPVHVIPVRPRQRVLTILREKQRAQAKHASARPAQP